MRRGVSVRAYCWIIAGIAFCGVASVAVAQRPVATESATDAANRRSTDALLGRLVTINVTDVPLRSALDAIAREARVRLQYSMRNVQQYTQPITLHLTNVPVSVAFEKALTGTDLCVEALPDGSLIVTRSSAGEVQAAGTIAGIVTDAATKKALAGAFVSVDSGRAPVRTRENGAFSVSNVSVGLHKVTVRLIGYRVYSTPVAVRDSAVQSLVIGLVPSATVLNDVVTTATGDRRRYEVGNAVGTIQADSIVPTTMIRNVSDLLQARIPGVIVSNTDGAVGAPSKIRLRGVTSLALNNDPIIILDGVRLNAQTTSAALQTNVGSQQTLGQLKGNDGGAPLPTAPLAPSRLDDIDPNTIESIDVLRGPSASSLYGTDAANGVIVIKTKRGHPGAWRLTVSGDAGQSNVPGKMPESWWGWGQVSGRAYTNFCNLAIGGAATVVGGGCLQDSVTQFNAANDPAMQTLGTGTNRSASATLSGGTESLLQFFSGHIASNVGMAKMSDAEKHIIARVWNSPAPSWMVRPNTEQDADGSYRTTFTLPHSADVSVTTMGTYRDVLNGGSGISPYGGAGWPGDTLNWLPGETQRTKATSTSKRGVLTTTGNYRPLGWLALTGTGGGDYGLRTDQSDLRAQDCAAIIQLTSSGSSFCPSGHQITRGETFVATANGSAYLSFTPRSWITLQTALGEQYSHTNYYNLGVGNNGSTDCPLAFGTSLLTPSPVCRDQRSQMFAVSESRDNAATAGVYIEETISLFGIYYTLGVRHDVASAFGSTVTKSPPNYPKFNFSYPLSEQSFFPKQSVVSSLRLRLAYGQSGNQASQTAVLNNYALTPIELINGSTTSTVLVTQLGNSGLRPERGTEWEGGFDISFLDNERAHAEVTVSRKYTRDEIVALTLAPSFGVDNRSQFYNLGDVDDRSFETSFSARVLDTRAVSWNVSFHTTKNTNKLVKLAKGVNANGPLNTQFRAGYPVFGYWGAPVEGYADINGDSILAPSEITFGPQSYMGAPYPKGELGYQSDLSLWNGVLRFNVNINQVVGQTTQLQVANQVYNSSSYLPRAAVDRRASLAQQAAYVEAVLNNDTYLGTSSAVRLNELSATYNVPARITQRFLRAQSLGITLAGRNLAVWSSYAGKDPNVDTSGLFGEATLDNGTGTPQPRIWVLRFNLGL